MTYDGYDHLRESADAGSVLRSTTGREVGPKRATDVSDESGLRDDSSASAPRDPLAAQPLTDEEIAFLRAEPMMVHTFDVYRIVATLDATRPSGDEALRQWVLKHATHTSACKVYTGPSGAATDGPSDARCNCGLRAALATPSSAPDVEGLDVERLARAMRVVHESCREQPYDLIDVPDEVAREYAALRDSRS